MASLSSSPSLSLGPPISKKLTRENYLLWKAQILPAIKSAELMGILNGSTKAPPVIITATNSNPDYEQWLVQDQLVLGYLLNSLSKEVLAQVAVLTSAAEVCRTLETLYSARSHVRVTNLLMQLSNLKKGTMIAAVYYAKMKAIGDELATAGRPVGDEEVLSFILFGLDYDYNPIVSSVLSHIEPITLSELYSQILAYKTLMQMFQDQNSSGGQFQSSANAAT
ncbi:hypothetical protein U9M48_044014 [Paspalum notatum var. saurae]|uniref:Retrotransposon Copia-like N-terminal domain-containing protein n=1 Tax=Paspalum notatum var. saurae TaxID=547442 RepID=A0AAQ3XJ53_PASNO